MAPKAEAQNWSAFALYLTSSLWSELVEESCSQLSKLDKLATQLALLGLRNPSEFTLATVAAFMSMLDRQGVGVRQDADASFALLNTVKTRVRGAIARARNQGIAIAAYVVTLPTDVNAIPNNMRLAHFAAGFVPPRLSVEDLMGHARAWPKRESNALVQPKRPAKRSANASLMPMHQAAQLLQVALHGHSRPVSEPAITILEPGMRASTTGSSGSSNALIHSRLPSIAQPPMLSQPAQLALPAPAGDDAAVPAPVAEPERTPARRASSVGRSPLNRKTPARTPARVLAGGLKGAASALAEAHYNKSLSPWAKHTPAQKRQRKQSKKEHICEEGCSNDDDDSISVQDNSLKRGVKSRPASSVGSLPLAKNGSVLKRPATEELVLKKPAGSEKPTVQKKPAAFKKPAATAAGRSRALKQTEKCIRSRAYHRALKAALQAGLSKQTAKEKARLAHRQAV